MLGPGFTSDCAARLCFSFWNTEEDSGSVSNDRTLPQGKGPSRGDRGSSETEASAQGDPRAVSEHGQHPCWGPHPHLLSSQEGAAYSVKGKPYVKVGARLSVTD